jgi:peptide/nickel transport system ATP-binding protein
MSLLNVSNLAVEYETHESSIRAVDGVEFQIDRGKTLGIVGESGSGKTTVAKAVLGSLAENGRIAEGTIEFEGRDLATLTRKEWNRTLRWQEISYIPQNAMAALDPVQKAGSQLVEVIRQHTDQSKREARERARELFERVDLDPSTMTDYPHELSGGQRQRVVIALALVLSPSLVIADEPTTGLDVVVQEETLSLLNELQDEIGCAMIFVTHDMSAVTEVADKIAVMYGGQIMEIGDMGDVFTESTHPYTIGLKNAFPSMSLNERLISIPGSPPDLRNPPKGCRFKERCPFRTEECETEPPMVPIEEGWRSKCHYADDAETFRAEAEDEKLWQRSAAGQEEVTTDGGR